MAKAPPLSFSYLLMLLQLCLSLSSTKLYTNSVRQTNTHTLTHSIITALYRLSLAQSSMANSLAAFSWLNGYEACRTGWDRFSKPLPLKSTGQSNLLLDLGSESEVTMSAPLNAGFPETWPWSHIITPNSDGRTEVASKIDSVAMVLYVILYCLFSSIFGCFLSIFG